MNTPYAHTLAGQPVTEWELLNEHLDHVAGYAAEYAAAFGAGSWGRVLGQWHDLGKYAEPFQAMLRKTSDADAAEEGAGTQVDHSTFGARHARGQVPGVLGQLLAGCIAGHHGRLADATPLGQEGTLSFRLDPTLYRRVHPTTLPAGVAVAPQPILPWTPAADALLGFSLAFFGRMLFSCLIDADRTATEAFCDPPKFALRDVRRPTLADLRPHLDAHLHALQATAAPTPVNRIRAGVLVECVTAAARSPGFFSLNVPTGGGKTLASLAFALHHAAARPSLRRVVVAIPFTSIIEQTADVYRRVLGDLADAALVEHHSNLKPSRDTRANQMASENWAAPLVVTTNVQLLESLFAARTTPCRKLHRLANSVIILDEAQTLPTDLLAPTIAALKELVAHYGCSVVLCTATQPALEWRAGEFEIGIKDATPIVADVPALHAALKRVTVERLGRVDDADLVERLADERQTLCVVNTRAHAASLYDGLVARRGKSAGCYHLSTLMCPQHRRDVLATIRRRLADGKTCRVVSTQLVEAGVDLDFPCVYRAAAGFDSIAQAAGRCNREGKLVDAAGGPALGRVYVFDAETPPPPGLLRSAADVASEVALAHADPIAPAAVEAYFRLFYWNRRGSHAWDERQVLKCFDYDPHRVESHRKIAPLQFSTAAERYKIIRDELTPVLVPYDDTSRALIARLQTGQPVDYAFYKTAQQYSVGVRDFLLQKLANNAALLPHDSGLYYLNNPDAYSPEKGLLTDVAGIGAEAMIA